ncbi:hypothetical protein [Sediminibacterium ginsengisoli]|uniref:Cytochrome c domain-containing protein n=1 Tax=Sediminibacterium ginsengisoli TaxID=413434 RepID=A0A1T4QTX4_9BACT|nr:hypothetical protein [Sediminibacterium ginsengisoli]SKA07212.1 hypothetical protein SAMN04488132_109108 [Sediminibacterium ginsengisoli]
MIALTKKSVLYGVLAAIALIAACKKDTAVADPTPPVIPTNPCAGKNISFTSTYVATSPCVKNGTVTVNATGSIGFTYSIDGGGFQTSPTFTNLSQGDHMLLVKDMAGCSKAGSVNVPLQQAGTLYNAVKTLLINNCNNCHSGANANGGKDFTNDCVIVNSADRIKVRAVDGLPTFMPATPLSKVDQTKITDWIAAGGRYTD